MYKKKITKTRNNIYTQKQQNLTYQMKNKMKNK